METGEGGFSFGTLIAAFGMIMFFAYIAYRISQQREELRDTVELITNEHDNFVNGLEAMVKAGNIRPVSLY